MTRTMYDGVTVSALPAGAPLYAGYVDGRYANVPSLRARFPTATIVEIAVSASTTAGTVLDVEQGDASPAEAPGWVARRRAAGVDPTVYCSASVWPSVKEAFTAARVPAPHWWIADYDTDPTIPTGAVAKQFKTTSGWDESAVADHWPGVDPEEDDMPTAQEIAAAVWEHSMTDPRKGGTLTSSAGGWLTMANIKAQAAGDAVTKLTATVGAMSSVITALTQAGGLTAEQVTAAAEAGAKAALAELGATLTNQ